MRIEVDRQRLHRLAVTHQFERQQKAFSAHIADERVALHEPGQLCLQCVALNIRRFDKVQPVDFPKNCQPGCAGKRISGIGETWTNPPASITVSAI